MVTSKKCITCLETLPIESFYAPHLSYCKECHKTAVRARYRAAGGRVEYERARAQTPRRKAAAAEYQRRARERDPEKFKARYALANAVRDGRVLRQPCIICGDPKSQAHHPDYSKPLEVEWLCFKHHREHGHGQKVRTAA